MTLAIPYWWSPRCYDIRNDDIRGGWKCIWTRLLFNREVVFNGVGFSMRFSCGFGSIIKRFL